MDGLAASQLIGVESWRQQTPGGGKEGNGPEEEKKKQFFIHSTSPKLILNSYIGRVKKEEKQRGEIMYMRRV